MTDVFVGIGSNLKDPKSQVRQGISDVGNTGGLRILTASSFYISKPVGRLDQPNFVNAVIKIDTEKSPLELLHLLLAIEDRRGRMRAAKNAPRTLDLDILLYGSDIISEEKLSVPHPRMHERAFVLVPLLEIAPNVTIADRGRVSDLIKKVTTEGVKKL